MIEGKIVAQRREKLGKRHTRRLRDEGLLPGTLYGHKQAPVALSANAREIASLVTRGVRVVDVEIGGEKAHALVKDVQWNFLGTGIQHFDLMRIDPNERVTVDVHVELKGTAPGVLSGGVLEHMIRTLTIECPAIAIPDAIYVKVATLEVGQAIHVRELEAPPNTRILDNPDAVVVMVEKAQVMPLPTDGAEGGPAQPELIGRKEKEPEAGAASSDKKK
jgi:large subunit ribosomal protein L25